MKLFRALTRFVASRLLWMLCRVEAGLSRRRRGRVKLRELPRGRLARALVAGALGLLLVWPQALWCAERGRIYSSAALVPSRPVGVVFGAGVAPDGTLSPVLRERVEAGIALYRAGKVRKLLMTGDKSRPDYDEVTATKRYAVLSGVPAEDVVRDSAGFRTYDSCYRARAIFHVDAAVLVTQEYHLPRALFLARRLGIDAVGLAARDGVSPSVLAGFRRREVFSCAQAALDSCLPGRRPRFLGPEEPIFGVEDARR